MISNLRREIQGAVKEAVSHEGFASAFRGNDAPKTIKRVVNGVISEENAECHDGMAEIARQDEENLALFLRKAIAGSSDLEIKALGYGPRHQRHRIHV
jgi:hypothetical protein